MAAPLRVPSLVGTNWPVKSSARPALCEGQPTVAVSCSCARSLIECRRRHRSGLRVPAGMCAQLWSLKSQLLRGGERVRDEDGAAPRGWSGGACDQVGTGLSLNSRAACHRARHGGTCCSLLSPPAKAEEQTPKNILPWSFGQTLPAVHTDPSPALFQSFLEKSRF